MRKNKIILSILVIVMVTICSVTITACGNSKDNHIEVLDIVPE